MNKQNKIDLVTAQAKDRRKYGTVSDNPILEEVWQEGGYLYAANGVMAVKVMGDNNLGDASLTVQQYRALAAAYEVGGDENEITWINKDESKSSIPRKLPTDKPDVKRIIDDYSINDDDYEIIFNPDYLYRIAQAMDLNGVKIHLSRNGFKGNRYENAIKVRPIWNGDNDNAGLLMSMDPKYKD